MRSQKETLQENLKGETVKVSDFYNDKRHQEKEKKWGKELIQCNASEYSWAISNSQ